MRTTLFTAAALLAVASAAPAFAQSDKTTSQMQRGTNGESTVIYPDAQPGQATNVSPMNKTTGQLQRGMGGSQTMVEPSAPPSVSSNDQTGGAQANPTTGQQQHQ